MIPVDASTVGVIADGRLSMGWHAVGATVEETLGEEAESGP